MDINNILTSTGYDEDLDDFNTGDHEPTMAELAAIEAAEKMELRRKKMGNVVPRSVPVEKPAYIKPKPKVKTGLPTNLFEGADSYKKTKMVSMEELNRKAEQEVREYLTRIAPLIERVEGKQDEFKFVSESLMRDFIADYQDVAMQKARIVKRYVLTNAINLYDLYKIIIEHLGIEGKNNKIIRAKQQRENNILREKSELHNKYRRIKKSGYIVALKDAEGMQGLECLEPIIAVANVESNSQVIEQNNNSVITDSLLFKDSDYLIISKERLGEVVDLLNKAECEEKEEKESVAEAQKAFYEKTLVASTQQCAKTDIRESAYYDTTLPISVNEDNIYLKYAGQKCRSLAYVVNSGKPNTVG